MRAALRQRKHPANPALVLPDKDLIRVGVRALRPDDLELIKNLPLHSPPRAFGANSFFPSTMTWHNQSCPLWGRDARNGYGKML